MFQAEFGSVWSALIKVLPNSNKSVLKLSQFVLLYILIGLLDLNMNFMKYNVMIRRA